MELVQRLASRVGNGVNLVLAAGFALVIAHDTRQAAQASGQWVFALGTGLAVCAVALLRGRGRARAAAGGLVLFGAAALAAGLSGLTVPGFTSGALAGLLVLGASAARRLPARQATFIGLVGTAVIAAAEVSRAAAAFDAEALFGLVGAVIWAVALGVGVWMRYLDQRRRSAIEAVRRQERLELARELHDVVAHHVTGIVVQAQAAGFAGEANPRVLASALSNIESAGTDALTAMRRLVGLLRAPGEAPCLPPTTETLNDLVARFERHGPAIDLRAPAGIPDPAWPPEVATTLYRIVQEALTNIARHAPDARSVSVTIASDPERVTAEITNDAVAPARTPVGRGYGLAGMRERVEVLGGSFGAGPLRPAGWSVRASLPLAAGAPGAAT